MRLSSAIRKQIVEQAKALIVQKNGCGQREGISSAFIKICDTWGVKFTCSRGMKYMVETYARQKRGFRLNIAPYCFGIFEHSFVNKFGRENTVYGYITEIVDVVSERWGMFYTDSVPEEFAEEVNRLINVCEEKLKFKFWDYHAQNLGFMGGDMVIIDWGDENNI